MKASQPNKSKKLSFEEKQERHFRRARTDFPYFCRTHLKIRTQASKLVPFVFNPPQKRFWKTIKELIDAGKPVRIVLLKARQWGGSTLIVALFYWLVVMRKYQRGLIFGNDETTTDNLWGILKRYHKNNPYKPMTKYDSGKKLVYDNPDSGGKPGMDSGLYTGTAGSVHVGASQTLQLVLKSECARYKDPDTLDTTVMQCVPDLPWTFSFDESTAQGANTPFHELWKHAEAGRHGYTPFFVGAWEHEKYRLPLTPGFKLTEEEKDIQDRVKERYGVDVPNTYFSWRRFIINSPKCKGDIHIYHQEYPEFPEDAFLFSGRGVFNTHSLAKYQAIAEREDPLKSEDEYPSIGELWEGRKPYFKKDLSAEFSVWQPPVKGETYTLGVDIAEGIKENAWSVVSVFNRRTAEQVAVWRGHIEPDRLAHVIARIARWYNKGYVILEINNHGLLTMDHLKRTYPNGLIYKRKVHDFARDRKTKKLGWHTNGKSKPELIDNFRAWVRDLQVIIRDLVSVDEMRSYIIEENGTYDPAKGCFGDTVIANALAVWDLTTRPWTTPREPEEMKFLQTSGGTHGRMVPAQMLRE